MKKTHTCVMLCVVMVATVFAIGDINANDESPSISRAGRIVVIADDWPTSDYYWSTSSRIFTLNAFSWLTEFSSYKRILIDSHFDDSLTYNNMVNTLQTNGFTVDIMDTTTWTRVLLENYDAVLIEIGPVDNILLTEYVNGGGGVLVVGGNAAYTTEEGYDDFLLNFGMSLLEAVYPGDVTLTSFVPHPVTNGVSSLRTLNPTPISLHSSEPIVLSTWGGWNWLVVYSKEPPTVPMVWVEVYGTGSNLAIRKTPGIEGELLKCVPDGWALKVIDAHGNSIVKDGYIWWEVEDAICGISGWSANKYLRVAEQERLENNAKRIDDVSQRKTMILEAVAHYYNNEDVFSSLYSSNDEENKLSKLKKGNFPIELILAIAAEESGGFYFDNEVYGSEYLKGNYETGGIGIMQITGVDNQGLGSKLKCYAEQCRKAGTTLYEYPEGIRPKHKYYGNTRQGIYANLKDGLRVLQWAYEDALAKNVDNAIAGALWRYNLGLMWKFEKGQRYLERVASRLTRLLEYFGENYRVILEGYGYQPLTEKEIQEWGKILRNYITARIYSFGEFRIYDQQQRITGVVNGEVKVEITNSDFYKDNLIIFLPSDSYRYVVVGIGEGLYSLIMTSVAEQEIITFVAIDIPTSPNVAHQYIIDWVALSRNEEGVILQIDSNGDGILEQTITTNNELTHNEFMLQTATEIDFDPENLNLKSNGTIVTVYIELPVNYDVSQIDVSSIMLNGTIQALAKPIEIGDYDSDGIPDLMVKFNRALVITLFAEKTVPSDYVIEVTGTWADIRFKGTATIRVISPP